MKSAGFDPDRTS